MVPYLRVSTDDKGQRPERQLIGLREWAVREGITLLPEVVDEGTSATKTNPFDRPKFLRAVDEARAAGAAGIAAENVDRVCGQGSDELGYTRFVLRRDHRLELFLADTPAAMHGAFMGNLMSAGKAEMRRDRIALDRQRQREGIQNRRARGLPVGGQAQQKVSADLVGLILDVVRANPAWGLRRVAQEVSARRGATLVSLTEKDRRKRRVSHELVRTVLSNGGTCQTERYSRPADSRQPETSPVDGVPGHPSAQDAPAGRADARVPREGAGHGGAS